MVLPLFGAMFDSYSLTLPCGCVCRFPANWVADDVVDGDDPIADGQPLCIGQCTIQTGCTADVEGRCVGVVIESVCDRSPVAIAFPLQTRMEQGGRTRDQMEIQVNSCRIHCRDSSATVDAGHVQGEAGAVVGQSLDLGDCVVVGTARRIHADSIAHGDA